MSRNIAVLSVTLLILFYTHRSVSSQDNPWINPDWNVPQTSLCPSEEDCSLYMRVEPDMTLYVVSKTTNQVAVVPPDGSEARIYNVAEQLQPYPQNLEPAVVPLHDRILLYRLNPFGMGIDILQVNRITGAMEQLVLEDISKIVSCSGYGDISRKSFFAIDSQHIVICSEEPVHHFNVHVVNVVSNTVEQTLRLGPDALDIGRTRPWIEMEVGLDGAIYFVPYADTASLMRIEIPEDAFNYLVSYDVMSQTYSLLPLPLDTLHTDDLHIWPVLIDSVGNKYIPYTGGTINNRKVDLFKLDVEGNILWHISNPPLPDGIRSIMLLDDGRFAISNFSVDVPSVFSEPIANASENQTTTDTTITLDGSVSLDNDGTISSYIWTLEGVEIATGAISEVSLSVGVHEIKLTVTDNDGLTGVDTIIITIQEP